MNSPASSRFPGIKTSLLWNFIFPVLLVIVFAIGSVIITASAKPMEAFMLAAFMAGIVMRIQGVPLNEITTTAMSGIKGIMPAVVILAFAYALNDLSAALNTADYIVAATEGWLTPSLLPMLAFLITGFIAFSTGTSWGTYAIMIPIAVPLAFNFSGDELNTMVYATLAAVAGGGVFWRSLLPPVRHLDTGLYRRGIGPYRPYKNPATLRRAHWLDQRRTVSGYRL